MVQAAIDTLGGIDVMVDNAGLETEGPFLKRGWESIREILEVNLAGPVELTFLALPHMLRRKSGHVVNIASIGAKNGSAPAGGRRPDRGRDFASTKAAARGRWRPTAADAHSSPNCRDVERRGIDCGPDRI